MIAAVVPLFQPDADVLPNVSALIKQVDAVYLVNDSEAALPAEIADLGRAPRVEIIDPRANRGIAAALNEGISRAIAAGADWILTVDQDTRLAPDYVIMLARALAALPFDSKIVGGTGSLVSGASYACVHRSGSSNCSIEIIQSGMLLRSNVFELLGPLDERLFIDGVDTEFMLRLHRNGLHLALVDEAEFVHSLGSPGQSRILGREIRTDNHSATRRYFITRNKIRLLVKFGAAEPQWARTVGLRLLRQSVIACLAEEDRWRKFVAILSGGVDGAIGRLGSAPPHIANNSLDSGRSR